MEKLDGFSFSASQIAKGSARSEEIVWQQPITDSSAPSCGRLAGWPVLKTRPEVIENDSVRGNCGTLIESALR